jgi:hypothetical protein
VLHIEGAEVGGGQLVGDKHLLGEVYSGDPSADSLVIRTSIRTPLIPNRSEEEFGEDCG